MDWSVFSLVASSDDRDLSVLGGSCSSLDDDSPGLTGELADDLSLSACSPSDDASTGVLSSVSETIVGRSVATDAFLLIGPTAERDKSGSLSTLSFCAFRVRCVCCCDDPLVVEDPRVDAVPRAGDVPRAVRRVDPLGGMVV